VATKTSMDDPTDAPMEDQTLGIKPNSRLLKFLPPRSAVASQ